METMKEKLTVWWLSFADSAGNRGCCLVEAADFLSAVKMAHYHKCNPGGQVRGTQLPDCPELKAEIAKWGLNRLITPEEMARSGEYVKESSGETFGKPPAGE